MFFLLTQITPTCLDLMQPYKEPVSENKVHCLVFLNILDKFNGQICMY